MATKKPKSSNKSTKTKTTTKPKTAATTEDKPVSEAHITKTEVKAEKTETTAVTTKSGSCLKGFFAKKYEGTESILTVFKDHKFYGALLGEVIGTALLTLLLFALALMGIHSIATYAFALIAILIAVYAFSGACLNPIVTTGMMASRRMSVIRGVMYIVAEIIGAWLGWLIFNSFHLAGGEGAYNVPEMTAIAEGQFWIVAMIEVLGAVIIGFFFARALKYKRSVFTFATTVAGGIILAIVAGYVVSVAFFGLQNNFIFNPASALMFQIFPTAGDNFGEIIGGVAQALSAYALLPMIAGVCGFYLADLTSKLSAEE
ncbi:aquaporin [Candidatus Saccharibacteria bacterium]|nr:aquaporin [Candidatus Saccharibacteria bacterium]